MADPASIFALAATTVQLAQVSAAILSGCYQYLGKARNAPSEITNIITEVSSLKATLEHLTSLTASHDKESLTSLRSLDGPSGPLQICLSALHELDKKLQSINSTSAVRQKLLWPIQGSRIEDILKELEKHKTTFILALTGDNARSNLSTEQTVKDVKSMLEDSKVSEQRQKILHWLKGADPTTNHNAAQRSREPNTGEWLIQSEAFQAWMSAQGELLWLHGIPGSGKTILRYAHPIS